MKRVELTDDEKSKSSLKDGDLLFARRSLVFEGSGKCSIVVNPPELTTFESSIIRARPNRGIAEPRFLFYLFASPVGRAIVASIATRTAVSGIRGSDLWQVGLPLPPLPAQRRIAGVLSAYDELIENNQRRIQILETMARAVYREWFVEFRFPGHEKIPRVASPLGDIPQGWEVKKLKDVCHLTIRSTSPKSKSSTIRSAKANHGPPRRDRFQRQVSDRLAYDKTARSEGRELPRLVKIQRSASAHRLGE